MAARAINNDEKLDLLKPLNLVQNLWQPATFLDSDNTQPNTLSVSACVCVFVSFCPTEAILWMIHDDLYTMQHYIETILQGAGCHLPNWS